MVECDASRRDCDLCAAISESPCYYEKYGFCMGRLRPHRVSRIMCYVDRWFASIHVGFCHLTGLSSVLSYLATAARPETRRNPTLPNPPGGRDGRVEYRNSTIRNDTAHRRAERRRESHPGGSQSCVESSHISRRALSCVIPRPLRHAACNVPPSSLSSADRSHLRSPLGSQRLPLARLTRSVSARSPVCLVPAMPHSRFQAAQAVSTRTRRQAAASARRRRRRAPRR